MKLTPIKGCLDYLPKEMELRQQVLEKILKVYSNNGFMQVKTPILENLENLTKSDTGDNSKMMFKTIKRGEKLNLKKENITENDIIEEGLRYDLTVPLARLFTNNRNDLPLPFKSVQADDVFRAEKPQQGRNRQFTQCDIDILGEPSIIGEIEIITTVMEAYFQIGLPNVLCRINSRKILVSIILFCGFKENEVNDVCIVVDKLEKIGIDGCINELRNNGFDEEIINRLIFALTQIKEKGISSSVSFGAKESDVADMMCLIETVKPLLPLGYNIVFDISIVRGQDYYTGAVFEMYCYDSGYKGAIAGGGRYDKMYGKFSGQDLSAVGIGVGLDPVLLVLSKLGIKSLSLTKKLALIYKPTDEISQIMKKKNELKQYYNVSIFPQPKNFKEFIRRIKLNGFDLIAKVDGEKVEEI